MGVRFECPAGHKLHVKAHLSGQRGICPECGVRFIVPSFSGGRAPEAPITASDSALTNGYAPVALESSASFAAGLNAVSAPPPAERPEWYVRPAAGGQYGPVDGDTFRNWVNQGRVAADAWVWCTGWADWKSGAEALRAVAPPPARATPTRRAAPPGAPRATAPAAARPSPPAAAAVTHPSAAPARMLVPATLEPDDSDGAGDESSALEFDDQLDALFVAPRNGAPNAVPLVPPTTGMRAVQARRRRLNQWLTLALGVLTLILFVVAVMVLNRDPAPQPSASPAAATAPASPTIPTPGS